MATPETDQINDRPGNGAHVIAPATTDIAFDATGDANQREDFKAHSEDNSADVPIENATEGSSDLPPTVSKELNVLESRGADLSHEVAVTNDDVVGVKLNGTHATDESLALFTPVDADGPSAVLGLGDGSDPVILVEVTHTTGEDAPSVNNTEEAATASQGEDGEAVNDVTLANHTATLPEAAAFDTASAEIGQQAHELFLIEGNSQIIATDPEEVTGQIHNHLFLENDAGDKEYEVNVKNHTDEVETASNVDGVPIPIAVPLTEPEATLGESQAATIEATEPTAVEVEEAVIVEDTDGPTDPTPAPNARVDAVESVKEELVPEASTLAEVELIEETATVVEDIDSHTPPIEAVETETAVPQESSADEQEVEIAALAQNITEDAPTILAEDPGHVEEPAETEEDATLVKISAVDAAHDQIESTPDQQSLNVEVSGEILEVVQEAGSSVEEANASAESNNSAAAEAASVVEAEAGGPVVSSNPVDEAAEDIELANTERAKETEAVVTNVIEPEAISPGPDFLEAAAGISAEALVENEVLNLEGDGIETSKSSTEAISVTAESTENIVPAQLVRIGHETPAQGVLDLSEVHIEGAEVAVALIDEPTNVAPVESAADDPPTVSQPQNIDAEAPNRVEPSQETSHVPPDSVEGVEQPGADSDVEEQNTLAADLAGVDDEATDTEIASKDAEKWEEAPTLAAEVVPILVEPPTPLIIAANEDEPFDEAAVAAEDILEDVGVARQSLSETETDSATLDEETLLIVEEKFTEVPEPPREIFDAAQDTLVEEDNTTTEVVVEKDQAAEEPIELNEAVDELLVADETVATAEGAVSIEESQQKAAGHDMDTINETTSAAEKPETTVSTGVDLEPESLVLVAALETDYTSSVEDGVTEIITAAMQSNPLHPIEGQDEPTVAEADDSVPAEIYLSIGSEVIETKASWTPSFQVVAMGGGPAPLDRQPESEESAIPVLNTTTMEDQVEFTDAAVDVEETADVPNTDELEGVDPSIQYDVAPPVLLLDTSSLESLEEPATSYSVHSLGSPLGDGADPKAEEPVERPWTPSYSVHSQGSSRIEEPPVERSWTPSYSVHSQGSPLLAPTHVTEDTSMEKVEALEFEEQEPEPTPKNKEFTPAAENVAPAQEPLESKDIVLGQLVEQPSTDPIVQSVADESLQSEEIMDTALTQESVFLVPHLVLDTSEEITQLAASDVVDQSSLHSSLHSDEGRTWVPSYSVSVQGSPSQEHADLHEGWASNEVLGSTHQVFEPSVEVTHTAAAPESASVPADVEDVTQPHLVAESLLEASEPVVIEDQGPELEISADAPQSFSDSLPSKNPAVSDTPVMLPEGEALDVRFDGSAELERPKSPWTPSYSVTTQGPSVDTEALDNSQSGFEMETSNDIVAHEEANESTPVAFTIPIIAIDEPRVSLEAISSTPNYEAIPEDGDAKELHEVFPTNEDVIENSLPKLSIPSVSDAQSSTTFTRKRLESTTSSRFFPGGWFSPRSEGRTSLEVAQGEFTPVKTTPHSDDVSDLVSESDDNASTESEEDATESATQEKSRWCVVM